MEPTEFAAKARLEALDAHLTLEEITEAAPILATEPTPAGVLDMLKPDSAFFVKSEAKAVLDFGNRSLAGRQAMAGLPRLGGGMTRLSYSARRV